MRKVIILSVAALIGACSDNEQPTSPADHAASTAQLNQAPQPNGKPQPSPVGFTKVTQVVGNSWLTVQPGASGGINVECPSGWTAIAGGHEFGGLNANTHPVITKSIREETPFATGWIVELANDAASAGAVELLPYVICAS